MTYILGPDGKTPEPMPDMRIWGRWMEHFNRTVNFTVLHDSNGDMVCRVSTVFLGLEAASGHLFETMAFGRDGSCVEMRRYHTWKDAEGGHRWMVNEMKQEFGLT